jgi:hypothetical protein
MSGSMSIDCKKSSHFEDEFDRVEAGCDVVREPIMRGFEHVELSTQGRQSYKLSGHNRPNQIIRPDDRNGYSQQLVLSALGMVINVRVAIRSARPSAGRPRGAGANRFLARHDSSRFAQPSPFPK